MTVAAALPANESRRLERLRELMVLDTAPEPLFDSLARMAAEACGARVGLLSLVDAGRQWFKANFGLPGVAETPRSQALCAHAILQDEVLQVPDARLDPRFAANPLVTGAPGIRFYAGAPLKLAGGEKLGTLCVIDQEAHHLTEQQSLTLTRLAELATQALVMRRDLLAQSPPRRSAHEPAPLGIDDPQRTLLEGLSELVSLSCADGLLVYVNPAYARHWGRTPEALLGTSLYDTVAPADRDHVRALLRTVLATGDSGACENRVVGPDGAERWMAWTNSRCVDARGQVMVRSVGRDITERKQAELRLAESERFLRLITDSLPVRIAYIDSDRRYRFANRTQAERFRVPRDQIMGRIRSELMQQPTDPALLARGEEALAGRAQRFEYQDDIDGEIHHIEAQLIPDIGDDGTVRGMFSIAIDITERHETERSLLLQSATLRSVAEAIPALVAVIGLDGRYRYVNGAYERWHGRSRDHLLGRSIQEILSRHDQNRTQPWLQRAFAGEQVSYELQFSDRDARHLQISYIPLRADGGRQDGVVIVAQDITQHRQEELRLLDLSQRDALTGLLNRAGFEAYLDQRMREQAEGGMALLCVDLDHFKPVNDRHGHPAGDAVLRQFGQRLRALVRPADAVARLGGDEFAVVLAGVREPTRVHTVATDILSAAHQPFSHGALRLSIGASVGTALGLDPRHEWHALMACADAMLYEAKRQGRGRAVHAPAPGPRGP